MKKIFKKLTKKSILSILAIIVIGVPLFYLTVLNQKEAKAWFNENWLYRKPIPISSHTSDESNVYISVTLDTSDTTRFQGDCGDLRFTREGGELLPYYISSGCGTSSTVIHVNFNTFSSGAQTIYYYYGNPEAPNGYSSADFSTQASSYVVGTIGSETQGPGPVAYWKFDDGQGLTAKNAASSGSANDGSLSGTTKPTWQPEDRCVVGKCLYFDGSTSYVNSGDIDLPSTFTISAWIRPKSLTPSVQYIVNKMDNTDASYYLYLNSSGHFYGSVRNGSGNYTQYETTTAITANNWYHVTLTYDGSLGADQKMKFYINGTSNSAAHNGSYDNGGTPENDSLTTKIGIFGDGSSNPFGGFIDDVKIYPYVRTAAQDKTDYLAGKANASAHSGTSAVLGASTQDYLSNGLVGYWKMDEASWNGTSGEVKDASGNGYNGTATTVSTTTGKFGNGGSFVTTTGAGVDTGKNFRLTDGTASIWFKTSATAGASAFLFGQQMSGSDGNPTLSAYQDTDQKLYFWIRNANGSVSTLVASTGTINDGVWHQATMTWGAGGMKLYLDGVLNNSSTSTVYDDTSTATMAIGAINRVVDGIKYGFSGTLDEFRIYNRALSPTEVSNLYNWAPGPKAQINMEEGNGTSANDSSGNSNNGTVNSGTWTTGKYGKGVKVSGSSGSNVSVPDFSY